VISYKPLAIFKMKYSRKFMVNMSNKSNAYNSKVTNITKLEVWNLQHTTLVQAENNKVVMFKEINMGKK
jgi:hypothetical protein